MGSGETQDGTPVYWPDIAEADAQVIERWSSQAAKVSHPLLKARYADLVWDMAPAIAKARRDPAMARLAIDAYLASTDSQIRPALIYRFHAALRAIDLAITIGDVDRHRCRSRTLNEFYREAIAAKKGLWWFVFDRLSDDKRVRLTSEERKELIESLEQVIIRSGDSSDPEKRSILISCKMPPKLISNLRKRRPA